MPARTGPADPGESRICALARHHHAYDQPCHDFHGLRPDGRNSGRENEDRRPDPQGRRKNATSGKMTSIPNFAPGCFGSALAFQPDHAVCRGCKFVEQCRPMHEENLARLRAELNVKDKRQRFEMSEPTQVNPNPGAKVLPKKVREYCERLDRMRL